MSSGRSQTHFRRVHSTQTHDFMHAVTVARSSTVFALGTVSLLSLLPLPPLLSFLFKPIKIKYILHCLTFTELRRTCFRHKILLCCPGAIWRYYCIQFPIPCPNKRRWLNSSDFLHASNSSIKLDLTTFLIFIRTYSCIHRFVHQSKYLNINLSVFVYARDVYELAISRFIGMLYLVPTNRRPTPHFLSCRSLRLAPILVIPNTWHLYFMHRMAWA